MDGLSNSEEGLCVCAWQPIGFALAPFGATSRHVQPVKLLFEWHPMPIVVGINEQQPSRGCMARYGKGLD